MDSFNFLSVSKVVLFSLENEIILHCLNIIKVFEVHLKMLLLASLECASRRLASFELQPSGCTRK